MLIVCVAVFLPTTVTTGLQGMPCQLESQVHSTNTLIDEVGLVEMEVGLDQLTWGDADLQRELRRLKDNSLKIPNPRYILKIALLRVIPTLTHYIFWHSFWHIIWKYIWHICFDILSDIFSGIFSDILSDILSGILSGIYSDILSGIYYILILPCHEFGLGVLLSAWINANVLNIHQMLVSHVCTQWSPLPLITIDTPKWPGPEFESRSWKVFWVLKKQDFGTGSEKRRRWKIQVYIYIFIYPINISLYKPLRKVTNHATHPRNQPSRCRGTAAWDSAYSSALAARPDTSSGTMMDETDEQSIKKRLSEGLDQRISPEFNTKEVQSWSKQQKTTEFAFWYRRKITNIRINHLKTVSCHPCLALFGYPGSNLGVLRRVRFFCLSTKSEHHDDNSNRSSNSQTVPNWSSSLRGKTIRNQWPMDLGIQMGSPVFRRNLILGMSHEQICTWQLSCKAGLELNLPKIWNGQCCKPLEWYPQGSGLSIPPKWIQMNPNGTIGPTPESTGTGQSW